MDTFFFYLKDQREKTLHNDDKFEEILYSIPFRMKMLEHEKKEFEKLKIFS